MIDVYPTCTVEKCEASPRCVVCKLRKSPRGRSVAAEMANGMCDRDCSGYVLDPQPGHLWPGEIARSKEAE